MNAPLLPSALLARATILPSREAWEAARTPAGAFRIGASIVSTILTDPWAALETLTGQAPEPDRATRIAWARGHLYEEAIIGHYALLTERVALPIGPAMGGGPGSLVIVQHRTEPWLAVSPDGGTTDPDTGAGFVEAKDYVGGEWAPADCVIARCDDYTPDLLPVGILTQAYVQIEAADVAFVDVARRMPSGGLRIIRVLPDPDTQREILDTVGEWRERHLVRGEPLSVDGSDACKRLLTRRFPGNGKETREATNEEAEMMRSYAELTANEKALGEMKAVLRNQLAASMGDTYGLTIPGGGKALNIPTKGRETVSLSTLQKSRPDLFTELAAAGLISRGENYRQLRTYNL